MKKILSFVALMLIGLSHVNAQTVMVNVLAPTSKSKCDVYKSNERSVSISGYNVKGGFTLGSPSGGLIADNVPGKAVFNLKGAYSKMTLIMGPSALGSYGSGNSIVTISGDGKRLLDEVVFGYDARGFILSMLRVSMN